MPYEKNKTVYQDDEWFEREQRNVLDVRNWNRDLMGQTFYQTCHDNKNKYRTIQFKWNPFVKSLKPMISDPSEGIPLDGMKAVPSGALQRAAQMTNMSMFNARSKEIITINLDAVTAEMLKAIMKKEGKYDGKQYLTEKIKKMYMTL